MIAAALERGSRRCPFRRRPRAPERRRLSVGIDHAPHVIMDARAPLRHHPRMVTRFCVVPDPIYPGTDEICDVHGYFEADDPQLPIVLGSTGIESAPVFETERSMEWMQQRGFPRDSRKTGERVKAAPGYVVGPEADPFE